MEPFEDEGEIVDACSLFSSLREEVGDFTTSIKFRVRRAVVFVQGLERRSREHRVTSVSVTMFSIVGKVSGRIPRVSLNNNVTRVDRAGRVPKHSCANIKIRRIPKTIFLITILEMLDSHVHGASALLVGVLSDVVGCREAVLAYQLGSRLGQNVPSKLNVVIPKSSMSIKAVLEAAPFFSRSFHGGVGGHGRVCWCEKAYEGVFVLCLLEIMAKVKKSAACLSSQDDFVGLGLMEMDIVDWFVMETDFVPQFGGWETTGV